MTRGDAAAVTEGRGAAVPDGVPRVLPRGGHKLPREIVLLSQRGRIVEATARTVAAKGYAATTIADICRTAGVSRSTFYDQFADKEECFLWCHAHGARRHREAVRAAVEDAAEPVAALRAAVTTYLGVLAAEPEYAKAFLAESAVAGPRALAARAVERERYVDHLVDWQQTVRAERPGLPVTPRESWRLAVAGLDEVVAELLRGDRTEDVTGLAGTALHCLLAVGGLPDAAARVAQHGPGAVAG